VDAPYLTPQTYGRPYGVFRYPEQADRVIPFEPAAKMATIIKTPE
jgi:hypothetical protein